jgi:hypothetical protein
MTRLRQGHPFVILAPFSFRRTGGVNIKKLNARTAVLGLFIATGVALIAGSASAQSEIPANPAVEQPPQIPASGPTVAPVAAQVGAGLLGYTVSVLTGAVVWYGVTGGDDRTGRGFRTIAFPIMALGSLFLAPAAINWVGDAFDGRGSYWATFVGALLGMAAGAGVSVGILAADDELVFAAMTLTTATGVTGGILGYWWSHNNVLRDESLTSWRLMPTRNGVGVVVSF